MELLAFLFNFNSPPEAIRNTVWGLIGTILGLAARPVLDHYVKKFLQRPRIRTTITNGVWEVKAQDVGRPGHVVCVDFTLDLTYRGEATDIATMRLLMTFGDGPPTELSADRSTDKDFPKRFTPNLNWNDTMYFTSETLDWRPISPKFALEITTAAGTHHRVTVPVKLGKTDRSLQRPGYRITVL